MWWSDPHKEAIYMLLNRVLAPYVQNIDLSQVNTALMSSGKVHLKNLKLKKEALDKFKLPVDVIEGYIGSFTFSMSFTSLNSKPLEVIIEDVYLLAVPISQTNVDPEEDERRAQAVKKERVENAEFLLVQGEQYVSDQAKAPQGMFDSFLAKVVSNIQFSVKNIHIRYEDKDSCPGHPFAAGITLTGIDAFSADENWQPAFISSIRGCINKLAKLHSLAVYFDTDAASMAGLPLDQVVKRSLSLIARDDYLPQHQFVVKPVMGEGRLTMNPAANAETPKVDLQLAFDSLGVAINNNQYRNMISTIDMYRLHLRRQQYHNYRPSDSELKENKARALLHFAGRVILGRVHKKNRSWSWSFFSERRDNRIKYVDLFKQKLLGSTETPNLANVLEVMERLLSYQDICFYRSSARSQVENREGMEAKKQAGAPPSTGAAGWIGRIWGSTNAALPKVQEMRGELTDGQRRELYDVIDYDERVPLSLAFEASSGVQQVRLHANLKQGSFSLRNNRPHGGIDIIRVVFDSLVSNVVRRHDDFEASASLAGFSCSMALLPRRHLYKP